MRYFLRAALAAIAVVIVGGYAIFWHVREHSDEQKNIDDAQTCRAKAEHGDSRAQYELGRLLFEGRGVSQDYRESARWYRTAADQGYAPAQSSLGSMYERGLGISQDYSEALKWYRKAADQGDADAEYNLGTMYLSGMGVSQDLVEAVKWYRMASNQGDANGQYGLGYMYYNGKGVQQDFVMAARLYHQAADQGLARAQYDLAYMYYEGRGVAQDRLEADRLLHQAAAQGEARAQRSLGINGTVFWGRSKIIRLVIFLLLFSFLISSLDPIRGRRGKNNRLRLFAAMVGMCYAALGLYLSFSHEIHLSETITYELSFASKILLGIFSAMLILILIPRGKDDAARGRPEPRRKGR